MKRVTRIVTKRWFLFIVILLCAAYFRLTLMRFVEFKGDEGLNLFLAARPFFHHPFPPASQASSAGILNFPLVNYLLFPIVFFTIYPPAVSFVIALLNVLVVGGFFLLFAQYHGRRTAFLASLIIAFSPWAILYSRKIWAQDFIIPLMLPFLWSVYKILEGKKRFWALFGLISLLLIQIHQVTGLIPVLFFCCFLIKKQRIAWKPFLLGVLLGLTPALPYLFYMASNSCIDCHETSFFARFAYRNFSGLLRPMQIISLGDFHAELGSDYALFASQFHQLYLLGKLSYVAYFLLPLGMGIFWMKNKTYRFFVPISLIPVALYIALGLDPLMHYYIALLPFFALFVGYLLSFATKKKQLTVAAGIFIFLYIGGLFAFNTGVFKLLAQKGGFTGDYGASFASSEQSLKEKAAPFRSLSNFKEVELAEYVPLEYMYGYLSVSKMLFPHALLQSGEKQREQAFYQQPNDPLLRMQIFAYYTSDKNPSWQSVVSLYEKTRQHHLLTFAYNPLLNYYLEQNLKNLYETPDFLLLYPRHWQQQGVNNGVALLDGNIRISITQMSNKNASPFLSGTSSPARFARQEVTMTSCGNTNNWCGTEYQPVFLRSQYYDFTLTPVDSTKTNIKERTYGLEVLHEIEQSIAVLK